MIKNSEYIRNGLFKEIIDNLPSAICIKEAKNLRCIYFNTAFAKLIKRTSDQILGEKITDIIDKENAIRFELLDRKALETKSSLKEIIKFSFNPAQFEIIELHKFLIQNPNSMEIDYIIDFYQKVTRELTADEILRETELLYLKILEYLPLGIILMRADDFSIFEVNPQFLKMFELDLDQVIYKSIFDLPFCKDKDRIQEYLLTAKKFNSPQQFELQYCFPNGKKADFILHFNYLQYLQQESWFLIIVTDVSPIQEANREIISFIQKEQELNTLKNRFISLISHELRTPLTAIILSVDLLQRFGNAIPNDEKEKHFEIIRNSVQTAVKLIENSLHLDKLTQGNLIITPKEINLKKFIEEIIERNKQLYNYKNLIIMQMPHEFEIETDEILLGLIFDNLLGNAIKYSPFEKPIFVLVNQYEKSFVFKVQNFGEPIPNTEITNLFNPFFRGSNVGATKGFGLGLSIVKKAVETLKGSISVESSKETGTIFTLTLPLKQTS